ncbi:hypothetical protein ACQBAT_06720 [Ornithinimicrobium sp. Y1847]|uniref:hypothetical protein n=1 Tax=Ornithinimicrobium sp. Y1847 TaxID=3405419 RepID=UPI003B682594
MPIGFLIAVAIIALVGGRLLWQWLTAEERETSAPFQDQVAQIPGVADVSVDTTHTPQSGGGERSLTSKIVFGPEALADPGGTAQRLADVPLGFSQSAWSVEGTHATAQVHYLNRTDPAPYAWWLDAAAVLDEQVPDARLSCAIRLGSLDCEVDGADPGMALRAFADVGGAAIAPWVEASSPDPDQPHGFRLRIGDEEFTDAVDLGRAGG